MGDQSSTYPRWDGIDDIGSGYGSSIVGSTETQKTSLSNQAWQVSFRWWKFSSMRCHIYGEHKKVKDALSLEPTKGSEWDSFHGNGKMLSEVRLRHCNLDIRVTKRFIRNNNMLWWFIEGVIKIDIEFFYPMTHYYKMRHWSMPKIAKNLSLFTARG